MNEWLSGRVGKSFGHVRMQARKKLVANYQRLTTALTREVAIANESPKGRKKQTAKLLQLSADKTNRAWFVDRSINEARKEHA